VAARADHVVPCQALHVDTTRPKGPRGAGQLAWNILDDGNPGWHFAGATRFEEAQAESTPVAQEGLLQPQLVDVDGLVEVGPVDGVRERPDVLVPAAGPRRELTERP
jgi:hypothetical protein